MDRRVAKVVVAIIRPPLLLLGFIFGGIYKLLFSGRDRRLALDDQQRLIQDIRSRVPFLASRENTCITPVDFGDTPPPFDYAQVDVVCPPLKFRFSLGRGELAVYVNREDAETHGQELSLVLNLLDLRPEIKRGSIKDFSDVDGLLREHWEALAGAFSEARYPELRKQIEDAYARDRVITKQWEIEINRRLYGDR